MTLVGNTPLKDAFRKHSPFNSRLVWRANHAIDHSENIDLAKDTYYLTVIDTIARWKWYGVLDIRYPRGK